MNRIKLDTISEFARQGYAVRVTCKCGNVSDWSTVLLMGELHRRRCSLTGEAWSDLKCSSYGKREATITPVLVEW